MRNLQSTSACLAALNDEFVWRRMEIIDSRLDVKSINEVKSHRTRAGVTLAYAHWEGYVKKSSELLLEFVASQRLRNNQISDSFLFYSLKTKVIPFLDAKKANAGIEALRTLRDGMDKVATISFKNCIDTESNLSSKVFDNIATSLGIDVEPYRHYFPFIDESIVNRRNTIAHGERLTISREDYYILVDRILELMTMYKTDLENIVALKAFRYTEVRAA